ncbi:hypothetical protein TRVL_07908 [Trypanosoma vivax]|nr:hypothetical protein TRVL_07908 [Trypanosoma vivax]
MLYLRCSPSMWSRIRRTARLPLLLSSADCQNSSLLRSPSHLQKGLHATVIGVRRRTENALGQHSVLAASFSTRLPLRPCASGAFSFCLGTTSASNAQKYSTLSAHTVALLLLCPKPYHKSLFGGAIDAVRG